MSGMIDVDDATFEQDVLKSEMPVLVDFWAEWCGPCKMLEPIVETVAREYNGKAVIARLNVDSSPSTPARLGVKGIPTLILFKSGVEMDRIIGLTSREAIEKILTAHS